VITHTVSIKGNVMKKLILISSLLMLGLTGCYVVPHRGNDDGYRNDRDQRSDRDHRWDRNSPDRDHDRYR